MDPAAPSQVILGTLRAKAARLLIAGSGICGKPGGGFTRRPGSVGASGDGRPDPPPRPLHTVANKSDYRSLLWPTVGNGTIAGIAAATFAEWHSGIGRLQSASGECMAVVSRHRRICSSVCNLGHRQFALEARGSKINGKLSGAGSRERSANGRPRMSAAEEGVAAVERAGHVNKELKQFRQRCRRGRIPTPEARALAASCGCSPGWLQRPCASISASVC